MEYFIELKRAEIARFERSGGDGAGAPVNGVTEWERNEYFDFF